MSSLDIGAYDPYTDTIVIEGIRYAGELLRDGLGINGLNAGRAMRIVNRNNGIVTMQTLPGIDKLLELLELAVKQADGWYDDSTGCGDCPGLDEARSVVKTFKLTGDKQDG